MRIEGVAGVSVFQQRCPSLTLKPAEAWKAPTFPPRPPLLALLPPSRLHSSSLVLVIFPTGSGV